MSMDFRDKVAVVTGASGNLGRAVTEAFEQAGARVVMVDRRGGGAIGNQGPADAATRFGVAADLTDAASARAAGDAAFARWGRIDVLCNIAGGFTMGPPAHETPDDIWRRMFELNVMTVVHMSAGVVPRMIAAGQGAIVNVAAASSARGQAGMGPYAVAKNGVVRLTESMAAELRPHGIAVTCLMPTIIDTPENRAAMPGADTAGWTPPADLARLLLWLAGPDAALVSGSALPASGRVPS